MGHPDNDSLNSFLAGHYERGAKEEGHEVRRINIHDLNFDPTLHKGYKEIQELEPDLKKAQENIRWCNHFVVFFPVWWGGPPALLKGFFDRIILPGFAFQFSENGLGWKKLLKGRSARVVVTTGSIPIISRVMFGDFNNEIKRNILGFSGFSPVGVLTLGLAEKASPKRVSRWVKRIYKLGKRAG